MAQGPIYLGQDDCMITSPDGTEQAVVKKESLQDWLAQGWTWAAVGGEATPLPTDLNAVQGIED